MFASLAGKTVNVEIAKEALKDILSKEDKPVTANEILRVPEKYLFDSYTDALANPPVIAEPKWDSTATRDLAVRACAA